MNKFNDFGIKTVVQAFTGDKIKADRILNREIIVHDYRIEDSKFGDKGSKCLWMQISINDTKYVVFTGAKILLETIEQVPKERFPFVTTIIKDNDRYQFT